MDHDPIARIAESYKTLADTQQILAQTNLRIEETQRLALRTIRGLAWLQGFAGVMIGLSVLFMGYLVWQHVTQGTEHAALPQALRTETRPWPPRPRPCWRCGGGASPRRAVRQDADYLGPCESGGESAPASG